MSKAINSKAKASQKPKFLQRALANGLTAMRSKRSKSKVSQKRAVLQRASANDPIAEGGPSLLKIPLQQAINPKERQTIKKNSHEFVKINLSQLTKFLFNR